MEAGMQLPCQEFISWRHDLGARNGKLLSFSGAHPYSTVRHLSAR
jgi:hypothetical protein